MLSTKLKEGGVVLSAEGSFKNVFQWNSWALLVGRQPAQQTIFYLKIKLPCDPTILFPGINPKILKAEIQRAISCLIIHHSPGVEAAATIG